MATDFTIADVLAWARTKPADEFYDYSSNDDCALCGYLRSASIPFVGVRDTYWRATDSEKRQMPDGLADALVNFPHNYGGLVTRLEKLCPDTVIPPSEWTRLDSYLVDIEMVNS